LRSRILALALVSLPTSICFATLNRSHSPQTALVSGLRQPQDRVDTGVPDSCPVTKPPAPPFAPPSPYPAEFMSNAFWFGTTKLWTVLPADGRDGLRQKRFWWRQGYDWRKDHRPKLEITGKRLDSPVSPIVSDRETTAGWTNDKFHSFIVNAFDVPAPGCWKMTAHYKDGVLSFVVWVTP